jgi:hypothetical protein
VRGWFRAAWTRLSRFGFGVALGRKGPRGWAVRWRVDRRPSLAGDMRKPAATPGRRRRRERERGVRQRAREEAGDREGGCVGSREGRKEEKGSRANYRNAPLTLSLINC